MRKNIVRREFVYRIIFNNLKDENEIREYKYMLKMVHLPTTAYILYIPKHKKSIESEEGYYQRCDIMYRKLINYLNHMENALINILGRENISFAMWNEGQIVMLLPITLGNGEKELIQISKEYARSLIIYLERELGFSIKIGIGGNYESVAKLPDSLLEAKEALLKGNSLKEKNIFHYTELLRKEDKHVNLICQSKKYMKEHYKENISLKEIAKHIHVSPYYLCRIFKERTGKNMIHYLTEIRISEAQKLLRITDNSITEIAYEVGYRDPNYFSRQFKKSIGISPKNFRYEERGQDNACG